MKSAGYCASPPTLERVRLQVYPFFFGEKMGLFIQSEYAHGVLVDEHKNITITQYGNDGESDQVKISYERFKTIVQYFMDQVDQIEKVDKAIERLENA